jgi:hypothetical protein
MSAILRRGFVPALAFVFFAAVAWGGEEEKPKPKPKEKEAPTLPAPTDEDVDKPGKTGAPPPTPIPPEEKKEEGEKDDEGKDSKPSHVNPFGERAKLPKYARPVRITYSDGKVVEGFTWRRADGTLRLFNRAGRAHQDYFLSDLKRIDVRVETEEFERDWRWKNQGSSEKVFLDIGYLWQQYLTTFTLSNGQKVEGDCNGQFTIQTLDGKKDNWFLYKKQSGRDDEKKKRQELKPLVYVKSVEFTDDFLKKAEEKKDQPKAPEDSKEKPKPAPTEK